MALVCYTTFIITVLLVADVINEGYAQALLIKSTSLLKTHKKRAIEYTPAMKTMHTSCIVRSRFAEVTVTSLLENSVSQATEVTFSVLLPEEAFMSNFTMIINNESYTAQVKAKDTVEEEYQRAKNQNQTAGKVTSQGSIIKSARKMEIFSISVYMEGHSKVEFMLKYEQLLRRINGRYELMISVRPNQIVEDLIVEALIQEQQGFEWISVTVPTIGNNDLSNDLVEPQHVSSTVKKVFYRPTVPEQQKFDNKTGIDGDVIIIYDTNPTPNNGYIVTDDKYFAYFFAPNETLYDKLDKNIVFVLDISGSMAGEKMVQTRQATLAILDQLQAGDEFMILLFDDELQYWPMNRRLVKATKANIETAKAFAREYLVARDSTNINAALMKACEVLNAHNPTIKGPNMVLFLTDGQPTAGEVNKNNILLNVASSAQKTVSIFTLGFGSDVDLEFLQSIAYITEGFPRKIYTGSDAAVQLEDFFKEIRSPLLYDIQFDISKLVITDVTAMNFTQYFAGSELVVAGELKQNGPQQWDIKVVAHNGGNIIKITKFVDMTKDVLVYDPTVGDDAGSSVFKRLYAYFKIKHLLQQIAATLDEQKKKELEKYATDLALTYHLVTPLTSFLIVADDNVADGEFLQAMDSRLMRANPRSSDSHYDLMAMSSGAISKRVKVASLYSSSPCNLLTATLTLDMLMLLIYVIIG